MQELLFLNTYDSSETSSSKWAKSSNIGHMDSYVTASKKYVYSKLVECLRNGLTDGDDVDREEFVGQLIADLHSAIKNVEDTSSAEFFIYSLGYRWDKKKYLQYLKLALNGKIEEIFHEQNFNPELLGFIYGIKLFLPVIKNILSEICNGNGTVVEGVYILPGYENILTNQIKLNPPRLHDYEDVKQEILRTSNAQLAEVSISNIGSISREVSEDNSIINNAARPVSHLQQHDYRLKLEKNDREFIKRCIMLLTDPKLVNNPLSEDYVMELLNFHFEGFGGVSVNNNYQNPFKRKTYLPFFIRTIITEWKSSKYNFYEIEVFKKILLSFQGYENVKSETLCRYFQPSAKPERFPPLIMNHITNFKKEILQKPSEKSSEIVADK